MGWERYTIRVGAPNSGPSAGIIDDAYRKLIKDCLQEWRVDCTIKDAEGTYRSRVEQSVEITITSSIPLDMTKMVRSLAARTGQEVIMVESEDLKSVEMIGPQATLALITQNTGPIVTAVVVFPANLTPSKDKRPDLQKKLG